MDEISINLNKKAHLGAGEIEMLGNEIRKEITDIVPDAKIKTTVDSISIKTNNIDKLKNESEKQQTILDIKKEFWKELKIQAQEKTDAIEKIEKIGSATRIKERNNKVCVEFKPLLKDGSLSDEEFAPAEMTRKGQSCFEKRTTAEAFLNDLKRYSNGKITRQEFNEKWNENKTGFYL